MAARSRAAVTNWTDCGRRTPSLERSESIDDRSALLRTSLPLVLNGRAAISRSPAVSFPASAVNQRSAVVWATGLAGFGGAAEGPAGSGALASGVLRSPEPPSDA